LWSALPVALWISGAEPAWEKVADTEGIVVYTRGREGTNIREVKATGMIDAPPQSVWAFIRDYPNYTKNMPYTRESIVLATENEGKTTFFYSVLDFPFIDSRDFVLKILDESDWKDGAGFLKSTWKTTTEHTVKERRRLVRIRVNEGYWLLEPKENGAKTWATYYVFTDPGGAIPTFIVNKANSTAVPDLMRAVRKNVVKTH
jgi:hypothetical protein